MISFLCSHCGAQLRVKSELAGVSGKCPRCGKSVEAPTPDAATVQMASGKSSGAREGNTIESASGGRVPELDFLAPPQSADEIGRLGNYRVQKILGQGGMGLVLLAEDLALKRPVALKVMKKSQAAI